MSTIADTVARLEDALERRPGFGHATNHSSTTIGGGLSCVSTEGDWTLTCDLPGALGGTASAPTPGVLLRAALGACMAMTYRLRAERAGLAPFAVTVGVETDSELAGMLLTSADAPPGFTEVRYHVEVECDAPEVDIRRVLDEGDRLSPMLDALTRATTVTRSTTITRRST